MVAKFELQLKAIFNRVSKVIRHCIGFALFCSVIGLRNLPPLSQPIRCKTKTNRDLITRVFPRFRQFTCVFFEFSLAPCDIFLCSDCHCSYFGF